jgi:hypothetical protein
VQSLLDLGPRARVVFAAAFLVGQATLIATAGLRPDNAFGFRMFSESSDVRITLSRRLRRAPELAIPVENGEWEAHDRDGWVRSFRWTDRVQDGTLSVLDRSIPAAYSVRAQIARLQHALDDVAAHTPDDTETQTLVADVAVRRNGRSFAYHLESAAR